MTSRRTHPGLKPRAHPPRQRASVCGPARRPWWAAAAAALVVVAVMAPTAARARSALVPLRLARGAYAPHSITTPHFRVEFSVPTRIGRAYALLCERAYRNFSRKFTVAASETVWEGLCHVYIFADREEFKAFAATVHHSHAMAHSGGYARLTKRDPCIVLFLHHNGHSRLKHVLIHEMTHVFLQLFGRSVRLETWLHEGFAQYFEFSYEPARSRLAASRALIKRLVRNGTHTRLHAFWRMSFPPDDLASYAQAWSLVDFMVRCGTARKAGQFVLAIKDGLSQEEALRQVFGCSLEAFEAKWRRYVLTTY